MTLTVSTSTAQQVVLTDDLPNFTSFNSFLGPTGSVSGSQITWNLGTLAPGVYNFSFDVIVSNSAPNGAILSNSASVTYLGGSSSVVANGNNVTVILLSPTPTGTPTFSPTPTFTFAPTFTFTLTPVTQTQFCQPYPNPAEAGSTIRGRNGYLHLELQEDLFTELPGFRLCFLRVGSTG